MHQKPVEPLVYVDQTSKKGATGNIVFAQDLMGIGIKKNLVKMLIPYQYMSNQMSYTGL